MTLTDIWMFCIVMEDVPLVLPSLPWARLVANQHPRMQPPPSDSNQSENATAKLEKAADILASSPWPHEVRQRDDHAEEPAEW